MNVTLKKICNKSNNQINENEEFEADLNELKRHHVTNLVICFLILISRLLVFKLNYLDSISIQICFIEKDFYLN